MESRGSPQLHRAAKTLFSQQGGCQPYPRCYWKLVRLQPIHYLTEHRLSIFVLFCRPHVEFWRRMPQFASPSTATPLPTTRPRSTSRIPPMNVLYRWIWNITSQPRCSKSFQSSPKVQRIQVIVSLQRLCVYSFILSDFKTCHF